MSSCDQPQPEGVNYRPDRPSPASDLVDKDLPREAANAASQLARSLVGVAGQRAISVFLEREDYVKVADMVTELKASLMLECLPAFVRKNHGRIVFAAQFASDGKVSDVEQSTVVVCKESRLILRDGNLYIYLPDERVVVSAEPRYSGGQRVNMSVRSSLDSIAFRDRWERFTQEHNYLRGRSFFADGKILEQSRPCTWESILLPEVTKSSIQRHVHGFLKNRHRLRELGVKCRRGLILSGPPGTGKTLLGKVLSSTLDASFMWVLPRHITEQKSFADILEIARYVAPTVVFMEDIDLFTEEREGNKWLGLGELMNQLDGAQENDDVVTIATTNRLDVIEKALRNRPGRFDRVIEIGAMDEICRRDMLGKLLHHAEIDESDMEQLVAATDGHTGAQLREVVDTLYILAVEGHNGNEQTSEVRLTRSLIDTAVDEVRVERKRRLGFHVA
ncbi:MAG: ATP-binding protein [Phycisphaerae bacterium]|jgi:hypothetical protein